MTTVTITLRDEDESFIAEAVRSGRYVSESDVVSDALAEFKIREEVRMRRIDELKARVKVGIDQLDRGESGEWNVEEIKARGRAVLAARQAAS